jgi:hypothetical protein
VAVAQNGTSAMGSGALGADPDLNESFGGMRASYFAEE